MFNIKAPFILLVIIGIQLFYSLAIYTGKHETENADSVMSQQAIHGKMVFQKYNCTSCHQIYGLGGYLGPDLTNVISSKGDPYVRALLMMGTARMPNFHLSDEEMNSLVSFLSEVDKSGEFPVKNYKFNWYGTVEK